MTPQAFIAHWQHNEITERAGAQQHFNDLCEVLDQEKPRDAENYTFERGAKTQGGQGWADVWKRGCFAWEYKAPGKDLNAALKQLMNYALALDNPPLLVVSDLRSIEIHTHFTGHPSEVHRISLSDLTQPETLQKLKWLFEDPERFKPKRTTYAVTEQAATRMGEIATRLTAKGNSPEAVAHFLIQCVFCMFAEDAKLLPQKLFETVLDKSNPDGSKAQKRLTSLFTAMQGGGEFNMEDIPWFNGGLFKQIEIPALETSDVVNLLDAAKMDWSDIEPAILGTLFERGLNPDMRSQLGAHYTDPATIMKIIRPVIEQPLLAEWQPIKASIAGNMAKYEAGGKGSQIGLKEAQEAFIGFLGRLENYRVLDAACGSGNFLYLSLKTLKDLEHRVNLEAESLGLQRQFSIGTSPANVMGIEINPYAAELARVTVWIGEIQWMLTHGYAPRKNPILAPLDHIENRDAILQLPSPAGGRGAGGEGRNSETGVSGDEEKQGENTTQTIKPRPTQPLPSNMLEFARNLRRTQTNAENLIWGLIRNRRLADFKFRRQHPIGRYILDFYCDQAKLAIELDGGQHNEQQTYDVERDTWLQSQGIKVLRFWNNDVLAKTEHVLESVYLVLTEKPSLQNFPSPPTPLPPAGEGREASWPACDAIVGNPPFLGGSKKRRELGDDYFKALSEVYKSRVPDGADLVCYWFEKARAHIAQGKAKYVGLVSTNSIRGGANRKVLERILDSGEIFEAWADEEWVNNGAAVRVSLICFDAKTPRYCLHLDGREVHEIYADLTGVKHMTVNSAVDSALQEFMGNYNDITKAKQLTENAGFCFMGASKKAPLDISGDQARAWLNSPNPNGRPNSDVLRPLSNAIEITRRPTDTWIIDFGTSMNESEAALYEAPFKYTLKYVKPEREKNNRETYRTYWWRHAESRPGMRKALSGLTRYIATPAVAKHRVFVWLQASVLPDQAVLATACEDDTIFGILHSRFHELWSLRMGTSLEDRPRYTPTTCFETFPFPQGLTPRNTLTRPDGHPLPPAGEGNFNTTLTSESAAIQSPSPESGRGIERLSRGQIDAIQSPSPASGRGVGVRGNSSIAAAAIRLNELRNNWLNPVEWVDWVITPEEEKAGYPKRPVAKPGFEAELKKRTLTNLYNQRPAWLDNIHKELDNAVAAAYGWADYTADMPDDEILRRLLKLNLARAEAQ